MLTCTPETLRAPPAPQALTLQRVDAFSGPDALGELAATAADLRDGLGVLARIAGAPAGGGLFTAGPDGEARIVSLELQDPVDGIALGPVIAAELARLAFRAGATRVALATGAEPGAYAAAGFLPAG